MKIGSKRHYLIPLLLFITMAFSAGCVYYNTFYNAKKAFNDAEKTRKKSTSRRSAGGQGKYKIAIEKSLKVIENHPNSKYYDDALYVLGVSYFYTKQYSKAERRFREIIANYAESKYAKEATLYLAKSKLEQDEMDNARVIFEEIFEEDYNRDYKTEAALALGEYHYDNKEYKDAKKYFLAVRDSLGNNEEKKMAQQYIAESYFEQFRFNDALSAYLQILGMNPDNDEKYKALYQSAICCYRLQRIDDGMDYLETLIKEEVYYDSLAVLRMALAEGYEYDDDLLQSEIIYEQVADETTNKNIVAHAYCNLGLIYQYDYDQLIEAKKYYDKAVEAGRSLPYGKEALQHSSDIGKLTTFARTLEIDTTTTQEMIDEAAETQYKLSELYWFNLLKPDTAILEMQYLIDSFPTTRIVPKAMMALSGMYKEHRGDTLAADSILRQILVDYPQTDYMGEVMGLLGLKGSEADTGYAEIYIRRAENALVDDSDYVAARDNYQYVVENFPDSKYYLQARFNLIWLTDMYESPGDSSLVFAYYELADSFPDTYWGAEARKRTSYRPRQVVTEEEEDQQNEKSSDRDRDDTFRRDEAPEDTASADVYVDPRMTLYISPIGDTIPLLDVRPTETEEEFEFPTQAYGLEENDFYLYFQILLDFSGKVTDYILKIRSENEEINTRVSRTVASMWFDPLEISNKVVDNNMNPDESGGYWFVYKYLVEVPEYLK